MRPAIIPINDLADYLDVIDASGTRTIAYDDRGSTVAEARPGSVTVEADYDGHGRLIEYDRLNAGAQAYVYNGLDDRVAMATPTATRRFVYDADGRVLGEYGASAAEVRAEFIRALPRAGSVGGRKRDFEFLGRDA